MRTSGFPCRFAGCDRTFKVADQTSMASLEAGSAARTAHEIADHDYHHATLPDAPQRTPYMPRRPKDRPAG